MLRTFRALAACAIAIGLSTVTASALTVEDFGTTKPGDPYLSQGYKYTPTYPTHGQCYGGWCLQEKNNVPEITNITTDPAGGIFNFLGFWVNANGKGQEQSSFLKIASNAGTTVELVVNKLYTDTFRIFAGDGSGTETGKITHDSNGYFVLFDPQTLFKGVTSIQLSALNSAQLRLDCVLLGTGDEAASGVGSFGGCTPDVPPIPLPAAGWLLLGAFGGLATVHRRRRRAA